MIKTRVTKKDFQNELYTIKIGYCDLQNLLRYKAANFYTYGVYGWNADIYAIETNYAGATYYIVTGYRSFGNIQPDYQTVRKFDQQAKKILDASPFGNYEKNKKALDKLIIKFIKTVALEKEKNITGGEIWQK